MRHSPKGQLTPALDPGGTAQSHGPDPQGRTAAGAMQEQPWKLEEWLFKTVRQEKPMMKQKRHDSKYCPFEKGVEVLVADDKPLVLATWNFSHFSKFHWQQPQGKAPALNGCCMLLNSGSCFFSVNALSQHSKTNKRLQTQAISQQHMYHSSVQENGRNMQPVFSSHTAQKGGSRSHTKEGLGVNKTTKSFPRTSRANPSFCF